MCRLLGAVYRKEGIPRFVFDGSPSMETLSRERWVYGGREMGPQADGWGMAWLEDGAIRLFRTTTPLHESVCARELVPQLRTRAYIVHLRKVSREFDFTRNLVNTQPFANCVLAFAHNGTVRGLVRRGRREGKSDSRILFEFVSGREDVVAALADMVKKFGESSTSLNSLVLTPDSLYALNYFNVDEPHLREYYTMYLLRTEEAVFVSSQPLGGGGWTPMGNGRMVEVGLDLRVNMRELPG